MSAWSAQASAAADATVEVEDPRGLPRDELSSTSFRVSLGLGASSIGPTARAQVGAGRGLWFGALVAGASDELTFFDGAKPNQSQWDVGVIGGLQWRGPYLVTSFGAGMGYVHTVKRGRFLRSDDGLSGSVDFYERIEASTLSLPMAAQATFHWRWFGIGVAGFACLNTTLSSIGLLGTLDVGAF